LAEANTIVGGSTVYLTKCFKQDELLKIVEVHSHGKIDEYLRELIYAEIRDSIPIEAVVQIKDDSSISDLSYGSITKLAPVLKKILPKPYHTVLARHAQRWN